jgi:C_GCAxxG_C_C family probable redox protein
MKINSVPQGFSPEERACRAKEIFKKGYNCCQSVVLAFSDIIGLPEETLAKLSSGFGGGIGRMREVCGTVSGMTFLAGFISPADDPSDHSARTANYALVQKMATEFKELNGSIICRELLGMAPMGSSGGQTDPAPSIRTAEYYKKRPCEELCGIAASIVAKNLVELNLHLSVPLDYLAVATDVRPGSGAGEKIV